VNGARPLILSRGVLEPLGVRLAPLGRGSFTEAYLEVGGEGRVFAVTRGRGHGKEVAAEVAAALPENSHVPRVVHVGRLAGPAHAARRDVWVMPYYRTPVTRLDHPEAGEVRRLLHAAWTDAYRALGNRECNYLLNQYTVLRARARGVPGAVVEALDILVQAAARRSLDYVVELAPADVGVDREGRLVLLDVIYDEAALKRRG
jgi:hypothetical protein